MLQKNNYAIKPLLYACLFISSGLSHAAAMHKVKQSSNNRNYEVLITETGRINKKAIFAPERLGDISVYYDDSEFRVESQSESRPIQSHFVDKELRGISKKDLAKLIAAGSYLSVNKMEGENEYILRLNHRLNGGGAFGAWLGSTLGYGLITFTGHGAIQLVSLCTGPFYVPVSGTLHKMLAVPIHTAACAAGIGAGIAGAVATGPV